MKKTPKKRAALTPRARELAPRHISKAHARFPHDVAVAVGLSTASRQAERERIRSIVAKYE